MLKKWHCPHLLRLAVLWPRAAAAPAMQQSIDISCPPCPQQQTRRTLLQRANGTDRQTDGHAYNTGSANSDVDTYHHHHQHRVKYSFIYKLSSATQTKHKYNMQKNRTSMND